MNVQTLKDLYMAELQEARSVEAQLSEALPKMIAAASAGELKQALEDHLGETRSQLERMEEILQSPKRRPTRARTATIDADDHRRGRQVGRHG